VYCVMKGTIPAGGSVPLHSHLDPESFFVISGRAQVLIERADRLEWIDVKAGDFVHIPGGAKHAHRNPSNGPVVELATSTPRLGRFFQEVARPLAAGRPTPPTPEDLERFARIAAKYQHWLASPEENAAVGIQVP
jgi:Cupin domain